MAFHNILGQIGEEEACRYLIRKGYTLLDRNWRVGHLEIDIIAEWYGEIIFVEVKTRSNEDFAPALTAVDEEKLQNLRLAAGQQATVALRRECEPYSATALQSEVKSGLMVHHAKKPPYWVALRGGPSRTRTLDRPVMSRWL